MKSFSRWSIVFAAFVILVSASAFAPVPSAGIAQAATEVAYPPGSFPRNIKDSIGTAITLPAKPVRIVSAYLGADEVLFSLVDPSRIVAVTSFALDPAISNVVEQAKKIPNQLAKTDPEAIISYKPDLVLISSFTDAGVIKQLRDAGLPVFLLANYNTIKDIEDNITLIGVATGDEAQASAIVATMERKFAAVAQAVKNVKPLTVMYYSPDGYSDGPGTTINEVFMRAGGINVVVAGGVKDPFPQLNDEFVVTQDPDVILLAGYNSYAPGFLDKFNKNPSFQTLKAIKNKRVYVSNDAHLSAVSQYIADGVSDVAAVLYPDVYQPTPEATMSATTTP
ncbi:MAG: ABC transporter substrate-binding protein [Chloroflexota bacterium]